VNGTVAHRPCFTRSGASQFGNCLLEPQIVQCSAEAQLAQIATKEGTDAERLVKDAALRLLEEDAQFRVAVREGIAQADRGEFIEEEENGRQPGADVALIKMRIRWTPASAADLQRVRVDSTQYPASRPWRIASITTSFPS